MKTYFDLPEADGTKGDSSRGEIEILACAQDSLPVVYESKHTVVLDDAVRFPDGNKGHYLRIFHPAELEGRHGTVMLTKHQGRFVLQRLFRHPVRCWQMEFPRGFAEPGMSDEENARKEIEEEMGVDVKRLRRLGTICPNTGLLATRAVVFEAELDALPDAGGEDRAKEAISDYQVLGHEELMTAVMEGKIQDAFTLGALMLAEARAKTALHAPHIALAKEPPPVKHRHGTFIEGFDSILYNTEHRSDNRVRFLAEAYYGLVFDSRIILAEPMIFDNMAMIRLMSRLRSEGKQPLRDAFAYAHFRPVEDTLIKTLLNPAYVSSCLSAGTEALRIELAGRLKPATWDGLGPQAAKMMNDLLRADSLTEDDRSYLEVIEMGMRHGEWLWSGEYQGRTDHGFSMAGQVGSWLAADEGDMRPKIDHWLKDAEFWPDRKIIDGGFDAYFKARSLLHQKAGIWREAMGQADFDRLNEYVNSAYMMAVQKTCLAANAVRTPMDFNNASHVAAQQVMNADSRGGSKNIEFRLNFITIGGAETDHLIRQVEDGLLGTLNELHENPDFMETKRRLGALRVDEPDYAGTYLDTFHHLVKLSNASGGPFELLVDGSRVVNVLRYAGTEVSRCTKEVDPAAQDPGANGCETRE